MQGDYYVIVLVSCLLLHQFPAKETRNKLGGPEETLFERSLGVGREEGPPNVVVVQLKQVLQSFYFSCVKCLYVRLND